jgi:hypothetical protein
MAFRKSTRREFLARTAGGVASAMVLPSTRAAFSYEANERFNTAVIGVSGYGAGVFFMPSVHWYDNFGIVALCDVDMRKVKPQLEMWDQRAREWPHSEKKDLREAAHHYVRLSKNNPPLFEDYRVMFDKMGKDIDGVCVATPDHTHAPASAAAMKAGKAVYAEKPLTITVYEGRRMRELAEEHNVATTMGNQGTAAHLFRRGVELIRQGALGELREAHHWFLRGGAGSKKPPQETQPIPEELNWNLWLGTVADRPYNGAWMSRGRWRDTSAGQLGNFGPHTMNMAFMGLNIADLWDMPAEKAPRIQVESECESRNLISFPRWEHMVWHVPARGDMGPVDVHWHHGKDFPPGSKETITKILRDHGATDEDMKELFRGVGAVIVGTEGIAVTSSHNVTLHLLPREKFADVDLTTLETLPRSRGHSKDWLHAARGGEEQPLSRFQHTGKFLEFMMLGDVSTRFPGELLEYDPLACRMINHDKADGFLHYDYREGWSL